MPYKPLDPDQLSTLNAPYLAPVPQLWSGEIAGIADILVRRKLAEKIGHPKGYVITDLGRIRLLGILRAKWS